MLYELHVDFGQPACESCGRVGELRALHVRILGSDAAISQPVLCHLCQGLQLLDWQLGPLDDGERCVRLHVVNERDQIRPGRSSARNKEPIAVQPGSASADCLTLVGRMASKGIRVNSKPFKHALFADI